MDMWNLWNLFLGILFVLLASAAYASWRGAPWVPTWKRDLQRIANLANLQKGDRFVELGCGTARVCRYLAKTTQAQTVGVELSMIQWLWASVLSITQKRNSIVLGDAFHHDLSSYTVVYMFLMPETYKKIRDKLVHELSSGSRVITYVWPIPDWTPAQVDKQEGSPDLFVFEIT